LIEELMGHHGRELKTDVEDDSVCAGVASVSFAVRVLWGPVGESAGRRAADEREFEEGVTVGGTDIFGRVIVGEVFVRIFSVANLIVPLKKVMGEVDSPNYLGGCVHDWVLALGARTEDEVGDLILRSTGAESASGSGEWMCTFVDVGGVAVFSVLVILC
jgi:hypothetical protein